MKISSLMKAAKDVDPEQRADAAEHHDDEEDHDRVET
jgi:hypothetical protein